MLNDIEIEKIRALSERRIEINERILVQEKIFAQTLSPNQDPQILKSLNYKINVLLRKETLFSQALQFRLERI
jgi:hypothetical protein